MRSLVRVVLFVMLILAPASARAADPENTLYMDVPGGRVVIVMRPDLAPLTVAHIRNLVRRGFYDGMAFHRVLPGELAQTGDPRGDGSGGSGQTIKGEFSQAHHRRGIVSMARTSDVDSGDSQFFICMKELPALDGKYAIWGEVTSGMEFIDAIRAGEPQGGGMVDRPDHIKTMVVAADVDK